MLGISKTVPRQTEIESALKAGIKGEVLIDQVSRGLYATDASIYQIQPQVVVVPRDNDDVAHAVKVARQFGLTLLPRGGGTSLAGTTVGDSLVIDFSKYMNRILEVNTEEKWVRVQPGRVRDELNAHLLPTGLHFGPETATANRANIGGMIGNNSSGTRSIVYGKTVDHVLELTVMLYDGTMLKLGPRPQTQWAETARADSREGKIYRRVREVIDENRDEFKVRYPKVMRRVGGYNLDEFPEHGDWNLAKLVVGSEGTLATVLEAKLNLEPLPKAKAMCVIHYTKLMDALRSVAPIVKHNPSMVELLDRSIMDPARKHPKTRAFCDWIVDDPNTVLIVEFFGDTPAEAESKIDALIDDMKQKGFGYAHPKMLTVEAMGKVFSVRQAGQGLMIGTKGDFKSIDFIDDSAVPVEVLPDYIGEVIELCRRMNVKTNIYAHASVGLLHVRPILNLKTAEGIATMKSIAEQCFEIVKKYGGSWSGEHGDGLARSFMNEKYFGPKLYAAFKEVKKAFDPDNRMNPGKIVDAFPMDENLRMGVQYRRLPEMRTHYFYREEGGFDQAVETCTGVGECRKTLGGVMCPSYRATRDEAHSTRGRANALRLAMTGQLGLDGMSNEGVMEVLDLCLGCKACKAECPSNVDMAKLKEEFVASYHAKHGASLGERFYAAAPSLARNFSGALAPLVNLSSRIKPLRVIMEKVLGIDRRRPLPKFASATFPKWFSEHRAGEIPDLSRPRVALFDDTFMNYHEPQIGRSAVALLEKLGYRVELANAGCCARPMISQGFLAEARKIGEPTLRKLNSLILDDVPVLVCEPGCYSALVDDLPDLIDNRALGERIQKGVMMIEVFLARELEEGRLKPEKLGAVAGASPNFLVHGHCHQKALTGTAPMKTLLARLTDGTVSEINSGCCGMAGSFGYDHKHYDVSVAVGEDRLFPAVRSKPDDACLVACGFSCRHQIADLTGQKAVHMVEALADAMNLNHS